MDDIIENSTGTVDYLKRLSSSSPESVKAAIEKIHFSLKLDGSTHENRSAPINLAALARHVLYYTLAKMERSRSGTTLHLRPDWTALANEYNQFAVYAKSLDLPSKIMPEDLASLCLLSTRRHGSQKKNFYSALALFLVDRHEKKLLTSEFMDFALPTSETYFIEQMRTLFLRAATGDRTITLSANDQKQDDAGAGFPEVMVRFSYSPSRLADLERFHDHFRQTDDLCAHFICYRPRKGDSRELMKTFVAIKPPYALDYPSNAASSSFNFIHMYVPPSVKKGGRISLGKVVPLDEGLYLVGGQRILSTQKTGQRALPFRTLKVIAVGWEPVKRFDAVFPSLVMSANNDSEHIVSRMAIRATPISHSSRVRLGAVKLADLAADIAEDLNEERKELKKRNATTEDFEKFELGKSDPNSSISWIAERILRYTNNNTEWDIGSRYQPVDPGSASGTRSLTVAKIRGDLEQVFGSDTEPKFIDEDKVAFDFWKSLRFAPLSKR